MANIFNDLNIQDNQISAFEDNKMTIDLKHNNSDTIVKVETFIFKVSGTSSKNEYESDLALMYLANSYGTSTDTLTINLTIPSGIVSFNTQYHIAAIVYDNDGDITSHLTPILAANHIAFIPPVITGSIENEKTVATNHIQANRYENITAKLVIDPTNYNNNQSTIGENTTFNDDLQRVSCTAYRGAIASNTAVKTLLIANNQSNTSAIVKGHGSFSFDGSNFEMQTNFQYNDGLNWWLLWEIVLRQTINGVTDYLTIRFQQKVSLLDELDIIEISFLDLEDYLSNPSIIHHSTEQDSTIIAKVDASEFDGSVNNLKVLIVNQATQGIRTDIATIVQDFTDTSNIAYVKINNSKMQKGKDYTIITQLEH
ncbi:MAG: hypothetical protein ACPGXZ_00785 [Saprospiraceae bacterium]